METVQQPTPQSTTQLPSTPAEAPPSLQNAAVAHVQRKTVSPIQLFIIALLLLLPIIGFGGYFFGQKTPSASPLITAQSPLLVVPPAVNGSPLEGALPLVAVSYTGGLCVTGAPCESTTKIMPNGDVISNGELAHNISAAEAQALLSNIARADYGSMRQKPFPGTCPIAYDGQEKIYKFYVAGREEVLPSCTYDIESLPLIKLVDAALSSPATPEQPGAEEPVMCTMEAKVCPDGSYVGRTGPKCEFAPCPK
jgi:hypothetical protein